MGFPKPSKPITDEKKLKALEVKAQHEKLHGLIVKIISWRTGRTQGSSIKSDNKITAAEWKTYTEFFQNISSDKTKDEVNQKIQEVYDAIKSHDGFE
jgi:hypothetical protein